MHTSEIKLQRFGDHRPTQFDSRGVGSDGQEDWLVVPVSRTRDSGLLEQSNFEKTLESIERVTRRIERARRHIAYKLDRLFADTPFLGRTLDWFGSEMGWRKPKAIERMCSIVDLPMVDGETVAAFAERLGRTLAVDYDRDYQTHQFNHWGPGWFEIIVVRPGSAAHREAQAIAAALSDYPVLDESDFSEREHEASLENVEQVIRDVSRSLDGDESDDWDTEALASEVFGWLWDNEQGECECHDGGGAYPSEESVERALTALGYLVTDESETE